ncbi:hypothetical protein B9Z55_021286 [Caenorhabditis nigoni]|nr:hypothetical protein B9Z55_021286 [Caenorhabditis nigoni]
MPDLVLENIIEFSNFKAILTLRQVCRDFRNFIDDLNNSKLPDSKITSIHVFIEKGIRFDFGKIDGYFDTISYSKNPKNLRRFNGKNKTLLGNNSDILKVAFRDLELILRFQKVQLSWLQFNFFPSEFNSINFSMKNQKIKTEVLEISATSQPDFLSILQLTDPENLRFFSGNQSIIEMDQLAETEQWKMAKSVTCGNFLKLNLKDIAHFSQSTIFHQSVSMEDHY